jgi:hypothetical protein
MKLLLLALLLIFLSPLALSWACSGGDGGGSGD